MIYSTQDKELIKKYIKNVALFNNVEEDNLEQIIADFSLLHATKNETVLFQKDTDRDLFIILKGTVKVTLMSDEGGEYILSDLHEGDYFGEMSLIDGKPRCATVVAVDDSTFAVLKREKLLDVIKQNPQIALDLVSTLVNKLRKATEREERFAFLDVRERLLKLFAELARTEGESDNNGFYKIKKRTQKELAIRIGASREATSQVLRGLVSKKIILEKGDFFLVRSDVTPE